MIGMNKYFGRIDKLVELRDCLMTNPERFNYLTWLGDDDEDDLEGVLEITGKDMQCNDNWCGTCACIAGHITALSCPADMKIHDFCVKQLWNPNVADFRKTALRELDVTEFGKLPSVSVDIFLFEPWRYHRYVDVYISESISNYESNKAFALAEGIARMNWVIDNKDLNEYMPLKVKDFPNEVQ